MRLSDLLVVYWSDTYIELTRFERKDLEFYGVVVSVTPVEVLIEDSRNGRKAVVCSANDPVSKHRLKSKAKK